MFGPHFNIVFLGGRGSILSEPGFRGNYSEIKHITCIFLNIFVQDCSLILKLRVFGSGVLRRDCITEVAVRRGSTAPSFLSHFKTLSIGLVHVLAIEPAISCSAVKRSAD